MKLVEEKKGWDRVLKEWNERWEVDILGFIVRGRVKARRST
jgi:hypothetical protein